MKDELVRLADRPELLDSAAQWFHEKWHVPLKAYRESGYQERIESERVGGRQAGWGA